MTEKGDTSAETISVRRHPKPNNCPRRALVLVDPVTEWRQVLQAVKPLEKLKHRHENDYYDDNDDNEVLVVITVLLRPTPERLESFLPTPSMLHDSGVDHIIEMCNRDVYQCVHDIEMLLLSYSGNDDSNKVASNALKVVGVVPLSEMAVDVSDLLAASLGCPHHNRLDLLTARRHKGRMKDVVRRNGGLRVAQYVSVTSLNDYRRRVRIESEPIQEQLGQGHHQHNERQNSNEEEKFPPSPMFFRLPLVVKTPQGFSTTDVFICHTSEEVQDAILTICGGSSTDEINQNNGSRNHRIGPDGRPVKEALVEEFIHGTEFAVNLMVLPCYSGGDDDDDNANDDAKQHSKNQSSSNIGLVVTDMWKYRKNKYAQYASADICNPNDPCFENLVKYAINVATAVGIRYGAAHVELKTCEDQEGIFIDPCMIEVGARLSGGRKAFMAQAALSLAAASDSRWDPFLTLVRSHCGFIGFNNKKSKLTDIVPLQLDFSPNRFVRHLFLPIEQSGRVKKIHGLDDDLSSSLSTYHSMAMLIKEGQLVEKTTDITTCAGFLWLCGERQLVDQDTKTFLDNFRVITV
mmetsp:Transcript_24670/g.58562  ORF Transcript_24670/g.58562 Transcript_24670/m.58562 type:complete len:576 (+) Transcript_24670:105-1832(+)